MPKLHEIIAVEGDRAKEATAILKETEVTFSKRAEHFIGSHSKYTPFDEGAADASEESKAMDTTVREKLDYMFQSLIKSVDITATKDEGNRHAKANIVLKGCVLARDVPATTLLMLEGKLKRWQEVFLKIPTLSPGREWVKDPDKGAGIYRDNNPPARFRTARTTKHKVLVQATDKHPAQIEKWQEDERIGRIVETTWSGMLSPAEKSELLARLSDLHAAVKEARMRANSTEVTPVFIGELLVSYLLDGKLPGVVACDTTAKTQPLQEQPPTDSPN